MKKFKFNKISIIVLVAVFMLGLAGIVVALYTNPTPVPLGTTINTFAVLSGSGVVDSNPSNVTGNVGASPISGTAIGIPSSEVTGTIYAVDGAGPSGSVNNPGLLTTAKSELNTAYNNAFNRVVDSTIPTELGNTTIGQGVYNSAAGDFQITSAIGTLTLDGGGNPNAVFIFKTASTLKTIGAGSHVDLTNGAQACNVFWQVGSDATLDTTSTFEGTIMAVTSITDAGGSVVNGRLLADADNNDAGAVTLDNTTITVPTCAPSLLIQKTIAGGGSDANTAWTLTATGAGGTNLSGITGATGANSDLAFPNATFTAGTYTLAETGVSMTNYTPTYSCSTVNNGVTTTTTSSSITLVADDVATCTITNTYTAPVVSRSSGGGTVYGCKDPAATNYNFFSSSKPELCVYGVEAPILSLVKVPTPLALPFGPGLVSYAYTLNNIGTAPATTISVTDNKCSPVNYVSGDTNLDKKLSTNETWKYTCSTTLSNTTTNTATATGWANGVSTTDVAYATVVVGIVPKLPKTGFPDRNTPWYMEILSAVLNLIK
ncbi:MAG: DUF3494 domain-containing protein [Candidatus Pacebacteria bacterium]|nr:DUF3494 domain-containing protein [Candidatus Paceibacterota bacterium]